MSLKRFILDLYKEECEFKVQPEVVHQLEDVVTQVVKGLIPRAVQMFPENKGRLSVLEVANAGSYYELTKIIAPNEFDFMLVVRELSGPNAITVSRACRKGYVKVKVNDPEKWGQVSDDQTRDKSFELAMLEFNMFVRLAVELFHKGLQPFHSEIGELIFNNIVTRGKPYKQFSFVQTAYFEWVYLQPSVDGSMSSSRNPAPKLEERNYSTRLQENRVQIQEHGENNDDDEVEVLYSRLKNLTLDQQKTLVPRTHFNHKSGELEKLELDVDLMACCRVPLEMLSDHLPREALQNPLLIKNGCHIVLKPCGNPKCIASDTECRLISYTKSEQELMRGLHPNWKIVYKFLKFFFLFSEILGVDSYKIKSAVLHLSQKPVGQDDPKIDQCMRMLLDFLVDTSARNYMPSFFNEDLNVWNVSSCYKFYVKWYIQLLRSVIGIIDDRPELEYNYSESYRILQVQIEQFCDRRNLRVLFDLEGGLNSSEFEKFCVQGNAFIGVVREMENELKTVPAFKRVAFRMKCHVFKDVMKEITRWLLQKAVSLITSLFYMRDNTR